MYLRILIATLMLFGASVLGISGDAYAQCTNTCSTSYDGECDDGGPGSLYSICSYGTDCNDCGVRSSAPAPSGRCANTCSTSYDGECDDGGPGALYSICSYGTDCSDCGVRY